MKTKDFLSWKRRPQGLRFSVRHLPLTGLAQPHARHSDTTFAAPHGRDQQIDNGSMERVKGIEPSYSAWEADVFVSSEIEFLAKWLKI